MGKIGEKLFEKSFSPNPFSKTFGQRGWSESVRIFRNEVFFMEPKDYIVKKIEGEYATLKDKETGEELFIALALLPAETDVGVHLHYEMLEYTVVEEKK
jgi:hypothetical protein